MYENPAVFSVNELSRIEKIGQFLMPRIDFDDLDSIKQAEVLTREFGVCGFIIFNGEIDKVREVTNNLQLLSKFPLFFGCDAERGLGQIVSGATYFPFLMSQGAINNKEFIKKQAQIIAEEMLYCGLNLVFAPVLDINSDPDNPIINIRSFGDDKDLVSKLAVKFIKEIQKSGVLACGKHFPGHGGTNKDSHKELPVLYTTLEELNEFELVPFKKAIDDRLSSIMPAHISYPKIDSINRAVTVSDVFLQTILRDQLGFNGLIISDSFKMDALGELGSESINTVNAIKAGVDIVLDPKNPIQLIDNLVNNKGLNDDHINQKLNRIAYYKRFIQFNKNHETTPDFENNKTVSKMISEKSVCMIKGKKINNNKAAVFIYDYGQNSFESFISALGLETQSIDDFNSLSAKKYSTDISIICILSTKVAAWTDNNVIPYQIRSQLLELNNLENEKILLSFGSPYVIKELDFFDTVITCFDSNQNCQSSVAEALLGKYKPQGILPVNI